MRIDNGGEVIRGMKYIAFWEYKPEDFDKVIEKYRQLTTEREKTPEKYTKQLFPPHGIGGEHNGFTVVEATSEQITNTVLLYSPEVTVSYVPIFESAKVIEQYLNMKK
jgi:hypothetical protein